MHFVWGQKSVLDALTQAVRVNGVPKITIGVPVILSERGGSHSELIGRLEVSKNFAPVALILGTAAVTFVYDNQIEEARAKLAVETRPVLIFGDGLINGEIHLSAFIDLAVLDLPASVSEGCEGFVFRIVDQNISVCQVKNLGAAMFAGPIPTHTPELPANLKGDNGLACPRRHREKNSRISLEDRLNGPIDRNFLIITVTFTYGGVRRGESSTCELIVIEPFARPQASPEVVRLRKRVALGFFSGDMSNSTTP